MFEHFLTDLLKVVILLDVLGVVAYFLMGAVRPRLKPIEPIAGNSLWEKLSSRNRMPLVTRMRYRAFGRLRSLSPKRFLGSRRHGSSESLEGALSKLRRVLNSYREGLA